LYLQRRGERRKDCPEDEKEQPRGERITRRRRKNRTNEEEKEQP
jgi:hypothetical protein